MRQNTAHLLLINSQIDSVAKMKPLLKKFLAKDVDRARRELESSIANLVQDHLLPAELVSKRYRRRLAIQYKKKLADYVTQRTITNTPKPSQKQPVRSNIKPAVGNVDAEWTHDLHDLNNPSASRVKSIPRGPRGSRTSRNDRLYNALNTSASSPALNSQFNIVGSPKPSTGISIRGLAGPYVVMAKNFAYGTTAADIESAMTPVGGVTLSCRLIAERPSVIAEIIFETKEGADNVVDTFNNQNVGIF